MSFRLKTILGIAFIEIILLSVLVFSGMRYLQNSNEAQLVERARVSAQLFATMTTDAMVSMDLATLEEMVAKTITTSGISYIRVRHSEGMVLAEKGDDAILKKPFEADRNISTTKNDQIFDVSHDISVDNEVFGRIELGVDTRSLELLIAEAGKSLLSVAAMEIILVGIFGFLLGGMLTRQLTSLQIGAKKVADGALGHTIQVRGRDELAETATSFNEMSMALATYAADLEDARKIAEGKRKVAESVLQDAVESLSQGILILDGEDKIVHLNKAYGEIYGFEEEQQKNWKTGTDVRQGLKPRADELVVKPLSKDVDELPVSQLSDGRYVMHSYRPVSTGGGVWMDTDITAIMEAEKKNRKLERDLFHSQKMESIGTLAGGIAHEINTPIQYIGDNLRFIGEGAQDLLTALDKYVALAEENKQKNQNLELVEACEQAYEEADIEFLQEELTEAVEQSTQGVGQISNIVLAMKEFAHPASKEKSCVDLNRVIERASAVCKNEWKAIAQLDLQLDQNLPTIQALEGELNQVLLNLIVNAAHAIEQAEQSDGLIEVKTYVETQNVILEVSDNGCGVSDEIKDKIFDPFFTTKEVGKGSGQGLAICRDIIVNKHNGHLNVSNTEAGGAKFTMKFAS